jgi:hypothetical protein
MSGYFTFFRPEIGVSRTASAVTTNDSVNLTSPARRLYVGTGGNINVTPEASTTPVIFFNFPSGGFLDLSVIRVAATNTTASNIVAML